ncbi:hypothetical protein H181DRAFT_01610 [Streptomyces sp. WMMB 714]|uniref:hypothetical protein n=1 Tax=Streptomyces sp. WMMB 714 TaxID=1286822 RepID=UPI0005F88708|nr:hypothetical protein [Streptomyces sp. WMMB 714]SCK22018.1 hypothetical protein H181DRAFT_01610 [Streptomyces sp. WMMB 714]
MHMNSAPHLLPEDRPEFERAVDEALRTAARRPALAGLGERLKAEQLRTMALSAASAIAGNAAEEYAHFVALRTELRQPAGQAARTSRTAAAAGARAGADAGSGDAAADASRPEETGPAGGVQDPAESAGAGLLAMVSVLVPLLAGTAAVIFLLLGYALHAVTPEPSIAAPMRGAGWVFAVLAAAGTVVGMVELWLTALRNGAGARRKAAEEQAAAGSGTPGRAGRTEELVKARAAWREALLERGIVPFLTGALADEPGSRAPSSYAPAPGEGPAGEQPRDGQTRRAERTPRLGYSHPDFSSRSPSDGKEERSVRPRYSSPDYSSPEYGGPEHPPR